MSEHIVPTKIYFAICATLLFFTGVTYWVALQNLGKFNVVVALTIATVKAALVVLFFMHAWYSPRRTQLVVVAGIFWLALMLVFILSDYLTRSWLPVAG